MSAVTTTESAAVAPIAQSNGATPEVTVGATTEPAISPQFAALARKEKALRLEFQKLKSERDAWANEQKTTQDKYTKDYVPRQKVKEDAIGVLLDEGFTLDQIAEMTLKYNGAQDPRVAKLMARIDELEGKTKSIDSRITDDQSQAVEQALNQMRNEAKILIDSDTAFETIKATNNVEAVVKHIKRTYDEDGVVLTVEDAAKEVEDILIEEAIKMAGLGKVKQRLQPAPAVEPPKIEPKQQITPRTLTHEMTVSAPQPKTTLTWADKKERARRIFNGLDPDSGKPIAR